VGQNTNPGTIPDIEEDGVVKVKKGNGLHGVELVMPAIRADAERIEEATQVAWQNGPRRRASSKPGKDEAMSLQHFVFVRP